MVSLVVLAGCAQDAGRPTAGDGDGGTSSGMDAVPAIEPFTLDQCQEAFGAFRIAAEDARPYVPEGFTLVGLDGPAPAGQATLVVIGFACRSDEDGATSTQLLVEIVVDPPAEHEDPDAGFHYVHVVGMTSSQAVQDALAHWGIPDIGLGGVGLTVGMANGLLSPEIAASNDTVQARLTANVSDHPAAPVAGSGARVFGVQDGELTGIVDLAWTETQSLAGGATVVDDGWIPFPVGQPGPGGYFWDYEVDVRPGMAA